MSEEQEDLINLDNFEDGQYDTDDSMYTDADNAFLDAAIERAMKRKRPEKEDEEDDGECLLDLSMFTWE